MGLPRGSARATGFAPSRVRAMLAMRIGIVFLSCAVAASALGCLAKSADGDSKGHGPVAAGRDAGGSFTSDASPDFGQPPRRDSGTPGPCGVGYTKVWDGDIGGVTLTSDSFPPTDGRAEYLLTQATAFFEKNKPSCALQRFEACVVRACDGQSTDVATHVTAGNVSVQGGTFPLSINPNAAGDGYEPISDKTRALWQGGETLTVNAGGSGEVPPFSATLIAPELVTVTLPEPTWIENPAHYELTAPNTSDIDLTWTGGGVCDEVMIQIKNGPNLTTLCRFNATDGHGTVPSDALRMMGDGGTMLVQSGRYASLKAGQVIVGVEAYHSAHGKAFRYSPVLKLLR